MTLDPRRRAQVADIDEATKALVDRFGLTDVLAALARLANDRGLARAFRIINAAYERLIP